MMVSSSARPCPMWSSASRRHSTELVKQRLCVLQVRRVEPLGEPSVKGGEEVDGPLTLALAGPEAGERGGGTQLEAPGALAAGDLERGDEVGLGLAET